MTARADIVRRGLRLNYLTIGYNFIEAIVSLAAGIVAGSVALVGFGIDSAIEVSSAVASQWRLRRDRHEEHRARTELLTRRIIGWTFVALAAYVTADAVRSLLIREEPGSSLAGIAILVASIIVMPVLAAKKHDVARAIGSRALSADAMQTSLCAWLSVIALAGVGLNTLLGWWWADPVAALLMVPIIGKEGFEGVTAKEGAESDCC